MSTKIAICADSHDNMPNIEKFLRFCADEKIKTMIHCGDVTTEKTREFFIENFDGTIYFADGNAEIIATHEQKRTNPFQRIKRTKVPFVGINIGDCALGACHKRDKALRLARSGKYDFVFYGHSHKPWKEKIGATTLLNPGTLAGMFYRATFATFDQTTHAAELILVDQLAP